ncbi:hypothetical protein Ptr902_09838 [Pyrenophora tritici-repentis]|nr:hypothetical protein Ptr902_09838 [Pyrenophora tritici-repentis]
MKTLVYLLSLAATASCNRFLVTCELANGQVVQDGALCPANVGDWWDFSPGQQGKPPTYACCLLDSVGALDAYGTSCINNYGGQGQDGDVC